ncbi:hypothetical protein [Butyrivibrio sp. NC2002]|uniref:hypothetical protein n=1 Tax=Butyrivibrio sp. NC2002 TaxID=1410610 RepID=UPI00055CB1FF|nr:hypothetical protein [Butyrivibrio sp. NC2002]
MVGATVKHIKFGEGTILKEEDGKVYVKFGVDEKIFPYYSFEKFFTCDDPKVQEEITHKANAQKEQKEKAEEDKKAEIKRLVNENVVKRDIRRTSNSNKYSSWIKFEGPQNENQPHEMVSVQDNGKTLYILNYVKRPSGVQDNAVVFMAAGIQDDYGNAQQSIIGRGILCGYSNDDTVKPAWIEKYSWMSHYQYYLVLKEFECIDAARKDGLMLNQVLEAVGADTYPSSEGQDVSIEKLRGKHTQKMHMMITDRAVDYINTELDKLFKKFGSRQYRSE